MCSNENFILTLEAPVLHFDVVGLLELLPLAAVAAEPLKILRKPPSLYKLRITSTGPEYFLGPPDIHADDECGTPVLCMFYGREYAIRSPDSLSL